jgi:acyl-coenzyme A synthetase/AMP-(fatty) acid ligase
VHFSTPHRKDQCAGASPTAAPCRPQETGHDTPPAGTHGDEPAFWLYSSGSTGRPKSTVHTQANLYWTAELYGKGVLGQRESDVVRHGAVLECAAIGVPDPEGLTKDKAFVVCKPGQSLSEDELKAFVKPQLAPYKYPRQIVFVAELRKAATGKSGVSGCGNRNRPSNPLFIAKLRGMAMASVCSYR